MKEFYEGRCPPAAAAVYTVNNASSRITGLFYFDPFISLPLVKEKISVIFFITISVALQVVEVKTMISIDDITFRFFQNI